MTAVRWLGFVAGVLVVATTADGLVRTVIVPRGFSSKLTEWIENIVEVLFLIVTARLPTYKAKDRLLALEGPISMIVLLLSWLGLFLVGFALIIWPLERETLVHALRESGSSMFTLGFTASAHPGATAVNFVAAATGLIVVALQIAYLPTLYSSFNRRETLVTMLQSRAGIPAWGPEILARHQLVNIVDALPEFYAEWERWSADLGESHTNYPVLIYFRSPHPLRNWVLGLLAVMDSAALYQALSPSTAPSETRLCIRMGFTSLRDIARVMKIPFNPDPRPDEPLQLTWEEFMAGITRLEEAGFPMERRPEEAWPHFKGWRVNYESIAYVLADRITAAPGLWSGPRSRLREHEIPPIRPADRTPEDPESLHQPPVVSEWKL